MERFLARLLVKVVVEGEEDKVCWLETERNFLWQVPLLQLEGGDVRVVPSGHCVECVGFT